MDFPELDREIADFTAIYVCGLFNTVQQKLSPEPRMSPEICARPVGRFFDQEVRQRTDRPAPQA
jgi:hypothetical protein